MVRPRILFMGTPAFALPALRLLHGQNYPIVGVVSQPDRPKGRGLKEVAPPVKILAQELGLPVYQPQKVKDQSFLKILQKLNPYIIVVAAFGQILPPSVLAVPPFGCINIHPSLLPKYRGVAPVPAAILNGDEFTGVSIMLLDKGVDTGPVLSIVKVPILPEDTGGLLLEKLSHVGAQLLLDMLPKWFKKEIQPQQQNNSLASYTKMITKEAGEIDWKLPAVDIWRRVRAYQPWPGCYTHWQGKQLKILEAVPLVGFAADTPGFVVAVKQGGAGFGVRCGDGVLGVIKVQIEGKKAITAEEFVRGRQKIIGAVLGSQ